MKRITSYTVKIVLTSLLIAAVLGLAGCGKEEAALTIWIGGAPQEVDYLETLIGEFEAATGYDVQVVRQPTDSEQRRQGLVTALNARQPDPDVFLMDVVWIGQFVYSGWLSPLDEQLRRDTLSTEPYFTRVIDLVDTYDNHLYALPVYVDAGLLYYRADLVDAAPQMWDELVAQARLMMDSVQETNRDFTGFVWQGAQYEGLVCTFLEFISSNGGGLMTGGAIRIDRPENVAALAFMRNLIHTYNVSPDNTYTEMKEEEVRRTFQRGNALFERNWPYAWKLHHSDDSPVAGEVGLAPLPHFATGTSAATLGGWHVGLSAYSDVPEEAWELVRFIGSYEAQKKLVLNLGWNPGREDLYRDADVLRELPYLAELREVFTNAVARPNLPYYPQVSRVIQRWVNECLAGSIEAEEALAAAQEDIDRIVAMYEAE